MANSYTGEMVKKSVSLVVVAVDDFTDRVITGNKLRVYIPGEKAALFKKEGYYVFMDLTQNVFILCLEGDYYEKKVLTIECLELSDPFPLVKVRLTPNRYYSLPRRSVAFEGIGEAGSIVRAVNKGMKSTYKLRKDYDKGMTISIRYPESLEMDNSILYIADKDSEIEEFLSLLDCLDEEKQIFGLSEELGHMYSKIGTILYPVYTAKADEKGMFYLPLPAEEQGESEYIIECLGKRKKRICGLYLSRCINWIDFREGGI